MTALGSHHRVLTPAEKADRANRERLGMCRAHQFRVASAATNAEWVCVRCNGVVTADQHYFYREGLSHRGRD